MDTCIISYHLSSDKCKLKPQSDTTTHVLEWAKSKILVTINMAKNVKYQKHSLISRRNAE